MDQKLKAEDRLLATLAYPFWYLVFPMIYLSPHRQHSPFLRYHAYHALFLGLGLWVGGVVAWTTAAFIGKIFFLFGLLLYPILLLLKWMALLLTLYCMISAWQGRTQYVPYITEFSRPFVEELPVAETPREFEEEAQENEVS
ncbi:MAG: DUF4870 domain-containing protein [Armatimonadetes bacterium]|nr:DUF4870 domain-containing protein [Armatimonadota bacterium]